MGAMSHVPPIMRLILVTVPFWAVVGYLVTGWLGVGIALMVIGGAELACAAIAPRARAQQEHANLSSSPAPEEIVGELYPEEDAA